MHSPSNLNSNSTQTAYNTNAFAVLVGESYMDVKDFNAVTVTNIDTDLIQYEGDVEGFADTSVFKKRFSLLLHTVG